MRYEADAGSLQVGDGNVRIIKADKINVAFLRAKGKGVHVLDVDGGTVQCRQDLREGQRDDQEPRRRAPRSL